MKNMISNIFKALAPLILAINAYSGERELIQDFSFQQGLELAPSFLGHTSYEPPEYYSLNGVQCERVRSIFSEQSGVVRVPKWGYIFSTPKWRLAEYGASSFIRSDTLALNGTYLYSRDGQALVVNSTGTPTAYRYSTTSKSIVVGQSGSGNRGISLKTDGNADYNGVWLDGNTTCEKREHAHLMISQDFRSKPFAELSRLNFTASLTKKLITLYRENESDPQKHALHFRINLNLQNRCGDGLSTEAKQACGHGQSVGLGFVIYDNRKVSTTVVTRLEKGRQRMLYRADTSKIFDKLLSDSKYSTAQNVDILPIIKEALKEAKNNPVDGQILLIGTLEQIMRNYRLTNINFGWENSSLFTGEIAITDLSIKEVF